MFGLIYKILNTCNGKVYIGQTTQSLKDRIAQHKCDSNRNRSSALHCAIRKYGFECFEVEQIDHAHSREELNNKERYWIDYYNSISPNGYNLTTGGDGAFEPSEETRKKMSTSHKGVKFSKERCEKQSEQRRGENAPWYGKRLSDEHKQKIRRANTGHKHSDETRKKMSESHKKFYTDEMIKRWKEINKNNRPTEEAIRKSQEVRMRKVRCLENGIVYFSLKNAGENMCVNYKLICNCCRGKRKTAGGYHWEYV